MPSAEVSGSAADNLLRDMKLPRVTLMAMLCIALFLFLPIAVTAKNKNETAFKLLQRSQQAGNEVVYLCPLGIRIENQTSSVTTVAAPPEWKICRFNPRNMTFLETPYSQLINKMSIGQVITGNVVLDKATVRKIGQSQFLTFNVDKYSSSVNFETNASNMRHRTHSVSGSFPQTFEMLALPNGFVPPQEAHIASVLYGSPDLPAFVLEITCHAFDAKVYKYVSTKDIRKVSVEPTLFLPPQGYTRVKTESDLVFDLKSNQDIMELVR
jgi:hypothetical protein